MEKNVKKNATIDVHSIYDGRVAHASSKNFRVAIGSARSTVQWSAVCSHKGTNKNRLFKVTQRTSLEICSQSGSSATN